MRSSALLLAPLIALTSPLAGEGWAQSSAAKPAEPAQVPPELDVPFVPTPTEVVEQMLTLAEVNGQDTLYDLGSGDGRTVIATAQRHGAQAVGVDIDPARVAEARANARRAGVGGKVEFRQADLFDVDLRPVTVLTLYLLPEVNLKLRSRILRDLRPGARVASHDFDMGDWAPDRRVAVGAHTVYVWVVPAAVAGTWRWQGPGGQGPGDPRDYTMKIDQKFQKLTASLVEPAGKGPSATGRVAGMGGELPPVPVVKDVALNGDRLSFTIAERGARRSTTMRYQGRVNGDSLTGVVRISDGERTEELPWKASAALARRP